MLKIQVSLAISLDTNIFVNNKNEISLPKLKEKKDDSQIESKQYYYL